MLLNSPLTTKLGTGFKIQKLVGQHTYYADVELLVEYYAVGWPTYTPASVELHTDDVVGERVREHAAGELTCLTRCG